MNARIPPNRRNAFPVRWIVVGVLPVVLGHWGYLRDLGAEVVADDRLAHTLILPIASLVLLWMDSDNKYEGETRSSVWSLLAVVAGVLLCKWATAWLPEEVKRFLPFWVIFATLTAAFILLYGFDAARRQGLAFGLLALSMPVPENVLSNAETFLQHHSANVAELMFQIIGMPYIRSEMSFLLPGLEIVVARECSGLRSAIGIQAATIVGARVLFRTGFVRATFCLYAVPLAIVKNALRICSLASIAVWVSPEVLIGPLHQYGGPVFTAIAAVVSIPAVMCLKRLDRAAAAKKQ